MKTTKTFLQITFVGILLAITAGCSTQQTWSYHANSYPAATVNTEKKIAVLPFEDARTNKNVNLALLGLLPIIPCGWENLETPEGVSMHINSGIWVNFKPTEDFPKAVADDLKSTGLFSDAYFSYQRAGSDYAVQGKIISTRYNGYMITYCLGVYGVYLWVIGLPAASTQNQLSVDMSLVNSATDQTLFSKTYTATPRKDISWIYYIKSDFKYSEMLAEVNKQFCQDIEPIILKGGLGTNAVSMINKP
ncbi:MAG TPA: hypothetical protein VNU95_12550 [Candidatus Acidoferrales bacterium]|jgi:hypothetical protein|nr:hypothetical protein [Candidatus Acidoferrales bacterium]